MNFLSLALQRSQYLRLSGMISVLLLVVSGAINYKVRSTLSYRVTEKPPI